jgi:DNA-binding transcriptional LysR family regulator
MSKSLDRITLLETFVRIADGGSISAAARDLNLSQPSVSRQLVDLETRLKTQLVRRNTHSLALTDAGLDLLADARQLLNSWQYLEEKYVRAETDIRGKLKVVAPVALGQTHLARIACKFQMEHPNVNLSWNLEDEAIRFTEVGCDCWIKVGHVPDDTLIVRPLGKVERLLVASPGLAGIKPLSHPEELRQLPVVALQPFEGQRIALSNQENQTYEFMGNVIMSTNNIFSLKEAACMGMGLVILPRWFIENELKSGELMNALPGWQAPTLEVSVAYLPDVHQPRRLRLFLNSLKQSLPDIPGINPP